MNNLKIRAHREGPFKRGVELTLFEELPLRPGDSEYTIAVVTNVTLEQFGEGDLLPRTPFRIDNKTAQQLMDELYTLGFRPTDAEDGRGTALHLADMRKIVAGKLGIEL